MPRLRPVFLGTETLPDGTVRDRTVLVVDYVDPDHIPSYSEGLDKLADRGLPPVLVFAGPVDVSDGEAYALAEPEPAQERTVLVLAANSDDARTWAHAFAPVGEARQVIATPSTGLLPGTPRPEFVLSTAAYQALPESKKRHIEDQLRLIQAKP